MAFVKKTWKDRIVQYANRRLLTKSGGEVEQVIVTRDEGTVTEAGDKFDAATMNDLEDRLEYAFDNVSTAIECTQAEYDTWKNAGQLKPQTSYIITDAPNLNPTASDIEYSSGVTVKQAIDSKVSTTDMSMHLVNKYLSSACQWFTTNLGQNTNTMVISTTDALATNNSIHILLFGRYGAWVIRTVVDGTGNFSSAEVTKLESGANTVTASVSGKSITLTGLGTWSTFLGVIVKDYYQTVTFTISQS